METSSLDMSESDNDGRINTIMSNSELAESLPSKTVPTTGCYSGKRKRHAVTVGDIDDIESTQNIRERSKPPADDSLLEPNQDKRHNRTKKLRMNAKRNPIYYFFEPVSCVANGTRGSEGDKHYRCYHGNHKITTVKASMKSNLCGLVKTLKDASGPMYALYLNLKERGPGEPITQDEIDIASGKTPIDPRKIMEFVSKLKEKTDTCRESWDQGMFMELLTKWMVASDKSFDEIESPEFQELLNFVHRSSPPLHIPGRNVVKRRVMDMGNNVIEETRRMFAELDCKISISLDAWTSSNMFTFMAIVAHYVNRDGELEELLIDFRELIGEHSGENMAEVVWDTLVMYGIEKQIFALMLDNASNNDTLVNGIEHRARAAGTCFKASWARLRCMPHTVHLATIQLLECIGMLSSTEAKKTRSRSGNYQDDVVAPLDRNNDDDDEAAAQSGQDDEEMLPFQPSVESSNDIFTAVDKLRKIVRAVHSSPQRKQSWLHQVSEELRKDGTGKMERALMLTLDVRTRWSSTHQMMRRALYYQSIVDNFVRLHKDLHHLELSEAEWAAIAQIAHWLEMFQSATTEMSCTKQSMLSSTHVVFRGLQEHVRAILKDLPNDMNPRIKAGLFAAHRKLSEYYYRRDQSPFYTWAALLDPRIMYEGLKEEYIDGPDLLAYLEDAKKQLLEYYQVNYACTSDTPSQTSPAAAGIVSSTTFSFAARYKNKSRQVNELEDYFKLSPESFNHCDPLQWWFKRRALYPTLYCLARDILAIPGSAVAVERIFSGGRDTLLLHRASLHPETIRMLMIVKQRLKSA